MLGEEIEELRKEIAEVKEESLAYSILRDYKKQNKRFFIMWIITFIVLVGMTCYTIWLLTDIEYVEETTTNEIIDVTQDSETGNNNFIGNDGDITNG